MAKPNVRFLGRVADAQRCDLLARCRAFIFPGEEDFGISPLEASACGKPVVAFAGGGALETTVPGVTGEFFREPTAVSLAETIAAFADKQYDPWVMRRHAERFATVVFKDKLRELWNCGNTRASSGAISG